MSIITHYASGHGGPPGQLVYAVYTVQCDYCEIHASTDDALRSWTQAAYSYGEGLAQDLHFCCRDHAERYRSRLPLNEVERFRIVE